MDELNALRAEIGAVDNQLFNLVAKRLELARKIGVEKKRLGLKIEDENVEVGVLNRNWKLCADLELEQPLAEELTLLLIKYSKKVQEAGEE